MNSKEDTLKLIDFSVKATGNYDAYTTGLCNGLLLARSFITGEEPSFYAVKGEVKNDIRQSEQN